MTTTATIGVPPVTPVPDRTVYQAGGGRRIVFSFIFLLLLPFFASLPAMILMRIASGLWVDTIGLIVLAAGFAFIMFLIVVELLASIKTRVEFKDQSVKMTLPSGRGPTPLLRYRTTEVPYSEIAAVETRREVYGGAVTPVMLRGARIVKKDGTKIPLGFVSEANTDPAFPYPVIAQQIASRAGLQVSDKGSVRRPWGWKKMERRGGEAEAVLDEQVIGALNQQHNKVVLALVLGLVLLVGIGLVADVISKWNSEPAAVTASRPK